MPLARARASASSADASKKRYGYDVKALASLVAAAAPGVTRVAPDVSTVDHAARLRKRYSDAEVGIPKTCTRIAWDDGASSSSSSSSSSSDDGDGEPSTPTTRKTRAAARGGFARVSLSAKRGALTSLGALARAAHLNGWKLVTHGDDSACQLYWCCRARDLAELTEYMTSAHEQRVAKRAAIWKRALTRAAGMGNGRSNATGAFYTLVPVRPRSRGERRSLRTFAVVSLRPSLAFNPRPRRLSTPSDAFELHPDIALYGTTLSAARASRRSRGHAIHPRRDRESARVDRGRRARRRRRDDRVVAAAAVAERRPAGGSDAPVPSAVATARREISGDESDLRQGAIRAADEPGREALPGRVRVLAHHGDPPGRRRARRGGDGRRARGATKGDFVASRRRRASASRRRRRRRRRSRRRSRDNRGARAAPRRGRRRERERNARDARGVDTFRERRRFVIRRRRRRRATAGTAADSGAFCTLVPMRPRWRGERRSLRTLPGVSLRPPLAFNHRPRRLSTPPLTPLNSTPTFACIERPSVAHRQARQRQPRQGHLPREEPVRARV